jgi:hypothetical protein
VNSNFSNASDSSSFNPSILLVKPGFTNSAFSPVAGCTRTIGCLEMTGARRALRLRERRVHRAQALQQLLDGWREALVRRRLRHPRRVAARRRHLQQRQDGDGRWLVLVRHIRVVPRRCEPVGLVPRARQVIGPEVDVVEFEVVLDVCSRGLAISSEIVS